MPNRFSPVEDGADFGQAGSKPPVCEAVEVGTRVERKERGRRVNEPFALSRARDTRARPPLFDFCLHSFTPMRQVAVDHGVRGEDFCFFSSPFRRFFFLFSMVP